MLKILASNSLPSVRSSDIFMLAKLTPEKWKLSFHIFKDTKILLGREKRHKNCASLFDLFPLHDLSYIC